MKNLEKLKDFCEKEGFELDFHPRSGVAIISPGSAQEKPLKDAFEGVEFIDRGTDIWPICRVSSIEDDKIWYFNSDGERVFWSKNRLLPSTQQAYEEQLKKTAFEKFGEIKKGDRFIEPSGNIDTPSFNIKEWDYFKEDDQLFFYNLVIYKQGKWAERVKERVEVKLTGHPTWTPNDAFGYNFCFHFKVKNGGENLETHKAGKFLASQLEAYLNGEIPTVSPKKQDGHE